MYTAEVFTGDDQYLASYRFSVEEFVPDKIRVNLDKDKEVVELGRELKLDISSEYLFGSPAAKHKYEMDVRLQHVPYRSKQFPKFNFSNHSYTNTNISNEFFEGELDDQGKATATYTVPGDIQSGGYLKGTAVVNVFDVTGRTVSQFADFKAFPKNHYLGMRSGGYYYHGTNSNIEYEFVAVNPQDEPIANFPAEVTLIRYEWKTVLSRDNRSGRYRYVSEKKTTEEWTKPLTLNGAPTKFNFQVSKSGQYELRVSRKGETGYIGQRFYAYYMGRATASSFEIDKEGRVEIILDKEKYAPGDQARVLFVTPFTGRMLVTIERDKVLEHRFIEVNENSTELTLDIGAEHLPNAYISATLFRPHSAENTSPFLVGHGYANLPVEDDDKHLKVEILAPKGKVKPRTKQRITVKTAARRNIYVTLAAVDEGILQVKSFKTPDPYASMYAKRRLMVESYDLYKYLLPEIVGPSKSPGGGDEMRARAKRLNPVKAKRFKLLAYWSGIRQTDGNGEVTIELDLPQYNGEVRLMAVAYEGDRFGSADRALTVADDIILQPAIPRFLAIGDTLDVPVTVMNTVDKSGSVDVNMSVSGPLALTTSGKQSVQVSAKGSSQTQFKLVAKQEVGTAKITFTTSGMDKVTEEIEIGVRPISPLVVESQGGQIKSGATETFTLPGGYIPGTQISGVTVSTFPVKNFSKHLRYLVGYPYGCVEQTTSKAFPRCISLTWRLKLPRICIKMAILSIMSMKPSKSFKA